MTKEVKKVATDEVKKCKSKTYMFFIGAGFSVPAGLPTASKLNAKILDADKLPITFHTDGKLYVGSDGKKPNFGIQSSLEIAYQIGIKFIHHYYNKCCEFDYEKFYEYLFDIFNRSWHKEQDNDLQELYCFLHNDTGYPDGLVLHRRIDEIMQIYPKLVHYLLNDRTQSTLSKYSKFFEYIKVLIKQGNKVEVYSLNHDKIFEELIVKYGLVECFCDGFSIVDTPFYEGKRPLERFCNQYDKSICLHKLHGSTSYYAFFVENKPNHLHVENLIKSNNSIDEYNLSYKNNNNNTRTRSMLGIEAEYLTGITSKAKRYEAPIYYKPQFENFERDLMKTDEVYVIGYGFKDEKVNDIIKRNINKDAKCVVIDPFINDLAVSKAEEILPNLPPPVRQSIVDVDWSENCCK